MRSRWFHIPELHQAGAGADKRVTWLELFYDLIFVAAFIQLGNGLSHHPSIGGFTAFAAIFTTMWVAWTGLSFYVNRFTVDDIAHRLLVFVQMFAIGAMAVSAADVLDGKVTTFALAYAVAQGIVGVMYMRTWRQVPEARAYSQYWGLVFGGGAVVWALSVFLPSPLVYVAWAGSQVAVLAAPFSRQSRALNAAFPWDQEHLSERYGLLTIIVLGESFVKVLSGLGETGSFAALLQASATLLITCCLWWIYFDDVAGSRLRRGPLSAFVWLYAHIPMQLGVTAVGVAIKKAIHFELSVPAPEAARWLMSGALALTFAGVGLIDSVSERRQAELSDRMRVRVRLASAAIILVLAPAGSGMTAMTYLALIASVCVAQVVFDLMMAPLEAAAVEETRETIADVVRRRQRDGATAPRLARARIGDPVRKGIPSELRSDIYFYFMNGGWARFLGSLLVVYIAMNLFFAGLYALQPGCLNGSRPDSFADAFFFSVQTMSTVGYGALSPATEYANVIMVAESAVGMLFVALATGLTFAKVSRPRASVLFSNTMVLTRFHGKQTLMFRAGNARGNEVVDAAMTLTALREEVSPEGVHLRRLHDLALSRSRTPMFLLSWTVMHVIDETSPLADIDWTAPIEEIEETLPGITVTMIGHDGTYSQTIYARHTYYPGDVRVGHRFVDVIGQLPDGRFSVDYAIFHDTEPEAAAG